MMCKNAKGELDAAVTGLGIELRTTKLSQQVMSEKLRLVVSIF